MGSAKVIKGCPFWNRFLANPDRVLAAAEAIVASADHGSLDRCPKGFNVARQVIAQPVPQARVVHLGGEADT